MERGKLTAVLAALAFPARLVARVRSSLASRRGDRPLLGSIEPRIRPLVDALNATGLVETFTSCEGHFGRRRRGGAAIDRERAHVGFVRLDGVSGEEVARFLAEVSEDRRLGGVDGAAIVVAKHHLPPLARGGGPAVFFELAVCPLDPGAPAAARRDATDRTLALLVRCVQGASLRAAVRARAGAGPARAHRAA